MSDGSDTQRCDAEQAAHEGKAMQRHGLRAPVLDSRETPCEAHVLKRRLLNQHVAPCGVPWVGWGGEEGLGGV